MIDRFFGVHPLVIRDGLWAKMKPGEQSLYIYLMAESERCCTREMKRADPEITKLVAVAGRTLCNARKKLQEYGLIVCRRGEGNKYTYVICDPATRAPYPGSPREPIVCPKRGRPAIESNSGEVLRRTFPTQVAKPRGQDEVERHGISGIF